MLYTFISQSIINEYGLEKVINTHFEAEFNHKHWSMSSTGIMSLLE